MCEAQSGKILTYIRYLVLISPDNAPLVKESKSSPPTVESLWSFSHGFQVPTELSESESGFFN